MESLKTMRVRSAERCQARKNELSKEIAQLLIDLKAHYDEDAALNLQPNWAVVGSLVEVERQLYEAARFSGIRECRCD